MPYDLKTNNLHLILSTINQVDFILYVNNFTKLSYSHFTITKNWMTVLCKTLIVWLHLTQRYNISCKYHTDRLYQNIQIIITLILRPQVYYSNSPTKSYWINTSFSVFEFLFECKIEIIRYIRIIILILQRSLYLLLMFSPQFVDFTYN